MDRNKNIDVLRAVATLLVVIYHSWVLTGAAAISPDFIRIFIQLGGEIGVTMFFALSGYGIYCSLNNTNMAGGIRFKEFMKKRLLRITPAYYFNLFVCLFFTANATFLDRVHLKDVLYHIFFIHNFVPSFHGQINGVLWTMGIIMQFYLIAIPLYKLIKKWPHVMVVLSVVITVTSKFLIFVYMLNHGSNNAYYFIAGRQLLTALDNFVIGMYVASIAPKLKGKSQICGYAVALGAIVMMYFICDCGLKNGINTPNPSGVIWHSLVAIATGVLLVGLSVLRNRERCKIYQFFLWIAKYEFGIYLWHLVLIRNLIEASGFIVKLIELGHTWLIYAILTVLSVITGVVMETAVKGLENTALLKKIYKI